MKYQLSPSQHQKIKNMIYNVIEDIMPENVNVEFIDGFVLVWFSNNRV